MNSVLSSLIDRIEDPILSAAHVIQWGAPIPSFGDWTTARIATIGINPSDREFTRPNGQELDGAERRFHTLKSLKISKWQHVNSNHIELILSSCRDYFKCNPYDPWFKKLDFLISGTNSSFYFPSFDACHLDLIPYATDIKWADLAVDEKSTLLNYSGDILGQILNDSQISLIILNGKSVVSNFQRISDIEIKLERKKMWDLPRKSNLHVSGYSYEGKVSFLGGVSLKRSIPVIGFNHNIQSSFGVTNIVLGEIRKWITLKSDELLNEI